MAEKKRNGLLLLFGTALVAVMGGRSSRRRGGSSSNSSDDVGPDLPEPPPEPPVHGSIDEPTTDPDLSGADTGTGPTEQHPARRSFVSPTPEEYVAKSYDLARQAWLERLNYPDASMLTDSQRATAAGRLALWSVAQWALETGYGRNEWGQNVANISASGAHQSLWSGEWMSLRGSDGTARKWRWYPDRLQGVRDYVRLIASRYHTSETQAAVIDNDPERWYRAILAGGYTSTRSSAERDRLVHDFLSVLFRVTQYVHPAGGGKP